MDKPELEEAKEEDYEPPQIVERVVQNFEADLSDQND